MSVEFGTHSTACEPRTGDAKGGINILECQLSVTLTVSQICVEKPITVQFVLKMQSIFCTLSTVNDLLLFWSSLFLPKFYFSAHLDYRSRDAR